MAWPRRRRRVALLVVALGALAPISFDLLGGPPAPAPPPASTSTVRPTSGCVVATAGGRLRLDVDQAENATTIAAVAKRDGLADRGVIVALVAALQESKLRNLDYGDLDSLGLFQQRPSQGWGLPSQLVLPSFAAGAFFDALRKVPGWEAMPVGDAAQAVQHSAGGYAYAPWEHQANILADALTGASPAALSCHFASAPLAPDPDPLADAMARELGQPALGSSLAEARGWTVASWLIAHGAAFGVTSVGFMGQLWTSSSGQWQPHAPAVPYLEVGRA